MIQPSDMRPLSSNLVPWESVPPERRLRRLPFFFFLLCATADIERQGEYVKRTLDIKAAM